MGYIGDRYADAVAEVDTLPGESEHEKLPKASGDPLAEETGLHEAAPRSVPVEL